MDVKIAFATSDGKNVDTHFGMASAFQIYQLVDGTSPLETLLSGSRGQRLLLTEAAFFCY